MLALFLLAVLALFALIVWMADGIQMPRSFDAAPETLEGVQARTSTEAGMLRVVSYNIAWGYGWGSEGTGSAKDESHFQRALERMAQVISSLEPDVVLLQEVDFGSTRSHHVDQAAVIARATGLPHVARAESWRANWVPFPYWPPQDHYGEMSSGGAVLSRFPILSNHVELLPKPKANPFWYNLFYLFRYYQVTRIDLGEETAVVINTHLEAFDPVNRERQATHLANVLAAVEEEHLVFGGDLNSVPAEATLRTEYPDEPDTDHREDRTVALFRAVDGLFDTVPPKTFSTKESDWFTFPAHEPNRKLDYLFHGRGLELIEVRVVTEAGTTSDHLPIFARFAVK